MKVFWSWQSDTPGKIGRFLVRDALNGAVAALQTDADVTEPSEREVRDALHLDHDRKDEPGSPDLTNLILDKIRAAAVVVADVTPVGIVPVPDDAKPKKLINSNVAIELGYALHSLTGRAVIMVMNTYYGSHEDLPFNIRHKAGAIAFKLAPDASKAEIAAVAAQLKADFITALKPYIAKAAEEARTRDPFPSAQPTLPGGAVFFPSGAILASAGDPGEQEFRFDHDRLIYLRVFPVGGGGSTRAKVADVFNKGRPMVLSPSTVVGGTRGRNEWGSIIFDFGGATHVHSLTQGFETGELWGISGVMFQPQKAENHRTGASQEVFVLPIISLEKVFTRTLRNYVRVMGELGFHPPFTVVMGITGLRDTYITMPGGPLGTGDWAGPVLRDNFQQTSQLASVDDGPVDALLQKFFNAVYDLVERDRSQVLTDALVQGHQLVPR